MSIILNGVNMPASCCECVGSGLCRAAKCSAWQSMPNKNSFFQRRADNCPLTEFPEKHGRIMDIDAAIEIVRAELGVKDLSYLTHAEKSVLDKIMKAEVLIEADDCLGTK